MSLVKMNLVFLRPPLGLPFSSSDAFGTGGEEFPSPKRGGLGWGQLLIEETFSKYTILFFGSGTRYDGEDRVSEGNIRVSTPL